MNIQQVMQTVQASRNPGMMLQMMARNNPTMQQAINYINQNGGDPKQAFYKLAEEQGVDPQEVLNSLNNFAKL